MRPSSIFESLITARQAPAVEPAARVELTVFSPSMIADLQRFERDGRHTEIVEVIAASIRHARPLSMKLDIDGEQVVLTVIPRQMLVHGPIDLQALSDDALRSIKVLQVEPVGMRFALRSPSDRPHEKYLSRPLGPLLWQLALHGGRSELLPEISGPVVYRLSPGLTLDGLEIDRAFRPTLHRLRSHACTLQELSGFTGAGRERVQRLLNALYLQSGLILSRSHHDANRFSLRRLLSP